MDIGQDSPACVLPHRRALVARSHRPQHGANASSAAAHSPTPGHEGGGATTQGSSESVSSRRDSGSAFRPSLSRQAGPWRRSRAGSKGSTEESDRGAQPARNVKGVHRQRNHSVTTDRREMLAEADSEEPRGERKKGVQEREARGVEERRRRAEDRVATAVEVQEGRVEEHVPTAVAAR